MRATGQVASLTGDLQESERRAGGGPGHPGRMAGRLRRRLAGFRRRLAGDQDDRRADGRPGRSGVWDQPRPAAARSPHLRHGRGQRADAAADPTTASCWCTAAWPRTSARSWRWSPRSTCCVREAEWQGRQQAMQIMRRRSKRRLTRRRRPGSWPTLTTREFLRADPDDHPLGHQPLHPDADRSRARASSATTFWGFLMLGGMSGGGMGFIFDPHRKAEAQDYLQELMSDDQTRAASMRCPSPWSRWSTISRSTTTARVADTGTRAIEALMPPATMRWSRRTGCGRTSSSCRRPAERKWREFAAECQSRRPTGRRTELLLSSLLPQPRDGESRRRSTLTGAAGGERLRPGTARADPRRPASRPDRPGPEPPAGQHGDRGRAAGDDVIDAIDGRGRRVPRAGRGGAGRRARSPW